MNEDFLENDDTGGDVGGILQRFKRQRRQPNPSGLSLHPMRSSPDALMRLLGRHAGAVRCNAAPPKKKAGSRASKPWLPALPCARVREAMLT